ncbi:hypothetical protein GCM10028820_01480 [Tessaracoccus terricola]
MWPMSPEEVHEDDLSPLAPVIYGETPEDENPEEDAAVGGVSDSDGIVRVWLEEGHLTKVRVSPVWYTRLGKRTLDESFGQALRMANATVGQITERTAPDFGDVDFSGLPRFDSRAFAVMRNLVADAEERWDAAIKEYQERPPAQSDAVEGRSKGVTVRLSSAGLAEAVRFEDKWLDSAQAGAIADHVLAAAQNAYSRYTPNVEDREELDAIEDEHRFLMATFKAMLNPKERS